MHLDLALGGGEQRLRARDEGGSHHGVHHELRVPSRQALDAFRIAGAAEQLLLVLGEFRAPRRAAVQVGVPQELLHLGGVFVGIDRHIGVDLDAGGVENDAVEIEDDGLRYGKHRDNSTQPHLRPWMARRQARATARSEAAGRRRTWIFQFTPRDAGTAASSTARYKVRASSLNARREASRL